MIIKGLLTLNTNNRGAASAVAVLNIDQNTHMAQVASNLSKVWLEDTSRMSLGFMMCGIPVFIPSLSFDCVEFSTTPNVCFSIDCEKAYLKSLGEERQNNYTRIYHAIFDNKRRKTRYADEF